MSETVLKISNLTKFYGSVRALNNISFEVKKKNVYGILGPNGSGKSTTLGIALNVVNKSSGDFKWFNGELSTHHSLKKIGAIIERPNFYPYMSAVDNLKVICKIKDIDYQNINDKLKEVNLYERRNHKFRTFSLGMKQRLAIASALLNDPEVLILDEPTNGLDPQGIHEIREIIRRISSSGTTILLASHLLDEVEKVCSHVLVIENGTKLYDGPVDQLNPTNGFFELKTETDFEKMVQLATDFKGVDYTKKKEDMLIAFLNEAVKPSEFNSYMFQKGITLSHLSFKKPSLEEQFLSLTRKK